MSRIDKQDELRFPGYDVLAKRHTLSWNEETRQVVDKRLAVPRDPHFLTWPEWQTLEAVCDRILPQPRDRPKVPLAAYIDQKLHQGLIPGRRNARLPPQGEAWQRGLGALDEVAGARHQARFHQLDAATQDALLREMQEGRLKAAALGDMPADLFFEHHVLSNITAAYYAHPTAWNEVGWGGPASPRGYVRMGANRRDPWEAVEAKPGKEDEASRLNCHVR